MFGISLPELLVILAVALAIMGPADLVRLCSAAGRKARQVRAAADSLRRSAEECERAILDEANGVAGEASKAASSMARSLPAPKGKGGAR